MIKMEVIAGGRQSGKTTKLIQKAAEEGGYIFSPFLISCLIASEREDILLLYL